MRPFALSLAPALFAACLALPAVAQDSPRLTVTGEASAEAVPDMATVTLAVTHEAATAQAAMDKVSADLSAVLDTLRGAGVEDRDLQTTGLSLQPVWSSYDSASRRRITGFQAQNGLNVRVRGLDGLGPVLDRVLEAGANTFQGLSLGMQDPGPLMDQARRGAVAEAMRKARLYAEAAGVGLGPVLSLSESGSEPPQPITMQMARGSGDAVPVLPGEVSLSASVTMVFGLTGQ